MNIKWQHIGVILTGLAALITACIGVYEKIYTISQPHPQKIKREYGIVEDKDGWVNLRSSPDVSSPIVVKILNGTNLEIIEKVGNWYKVYTESGRTGFIYKDRLVLHYYE